MSGTRFIKSVRCVLAASMLFLADAVSAEQSEPITLKIQAAWPVSTPLYDDLALFAQTVNQMAGGRLKVEIFPAGAIVPVSELLGAVSNRVIDGAHTAPGYQIGKDRTAIPLSHGPFFGMDHVDTFGWLYSGGGLKLLNDWYQNVLQMNVVSLPIGGYGNQALGWFKEPISGWDDLKGRKLRNYGLGAEILKEAGTSIVTLPAGEVVPAGQRGLIDGGEFATAANDKQLGLQKVWKHLYVATVSEQISLVDLVLNKQAWDSLPPDLQAMIKTATIATYLLTRVLEDSRNAAAIQTMIESDAVMVHQTPADIKLKSLEIWDRISQDDASKNPFFKSVLDSQRKYAEEVVPYRLSSTLPYEFIGNYYWKNKVYIKESTDAQK